MNRISFAWLLLHISYYCATLCTYINSGWEIRSRFRRFYLWQVSGNLNCRETTKSCNSAPFFCTRLVEIHLKPYDIGEQWIYKMERRLVLKRKQNTGNVYTKSMEHDKREQNSVCFTNFSLIGAIQMVNDWNRLSRIKFQQNWIKIRLSTLTISIWSNSMCVHIIMSISFSKITIHAVYTRWGKNINRLC